MNTRAFLLPLIFSLVSLPGLGGLAAGPGSSAALLRQAESQDDLAALETLREALRLHPGNVEARYRLAFIYQKMNRMKEAEAIYRQVLQRQACHTRALNNLGGVELDLGHQGRAEQLYRRAIRCDGNFHLAHYNLANIQRDRGEYRAAVSSYQRALRARPDHARSHHNLGIVYHYLAMQGGQQAFALHDRSLVHLRRALRLEPKDARGRFNYASVLARAGQLDLALRELKTAERFSRQSPALRSRIRKAYRRIKYEHLPPDGA